jgi:hypothetical protein
MASWVTLVPGRNDKGTVVAAGAKAAAAVEFEFRANVHGFVDEALVQA